MIEALCLFGGYADGAAIRRTDGVAVVASGLAFTVFNQVLIETAVATHAAVAAAVQLLRARGAPFVVSLRIDPDDGFVGAAERLRLVRVSEQPLPGMAMHPLPD